MNKKELSQELERVTDLNLEQSLVVMNTIEKHFFFSKKQDDIIISEIAVKLGLSLDKAKVEYDAAKNLLLSEMKNKLFHPFSAKEKKAV